MRLSKTEIKLVQEFISTNKINVHTISNPSETCDCGSMDLDFDQECNNCGELTWNCDSNFGTCDISADQGSVQPMVMLDQDGALIKIEVLDHIAYYLHGLAGAY